MTFRQMSLFPSDADLACDLNKKFPKALRCRIDRALREVRGILELKTDGEYSNSQLRHWTEIVLRDMEYLPIRKERRKRFGRVSQESTSRADYKSAAANDDTFRD